jgi:hypothetical protein
LFGGFNEFLQPLKKLLGRLHKFLKTLKEFVGSPKEFFGTLHKFVGRFKELFGRQNKLSEPSKKLPRWFRQLSATWRGLPGSAAVFGGRPVYLPLAVCGDLPGCRHGLPCPQDFPGTAQMFPA